MTPRHYNFPQATGLATLPIAHNWITNHLPLAVNEERHRETVEHYMLKHTMGWETMAIYNMMDWSA